jgi:small redox-active disulfide protein 2
MGGPNFFDMRMDSGTESREHGMMKIEVLGPGCKRCHTLEENVRTAVREMGIEAEVLLVSDIKEIAARGILMTPGGRAERRVWSPSQREPGQEDSGGAGFAGVIRGKASCPPSRNNPGIPWVEGPSPRQDRTISVSRWRIRHALLPT